MKRRFDRLSILIIPFDSIPFLTLRVFGLFRRILIKIMFIPVNDIEPPSNTLNYLCRQFFSYRCTLVDFLAHYLEISVDSEYEVRVLNSVLCFVQNERNWVSFRNKIQWKSTNATENIYNRKYFALIVSILSLALLNAKCKMLNNFNPSKRTKIRNHENISAKILILHSTSMSAVCKNILDSVERQLTLEQSWTVWPMMYQFFYYRMFVAIFFNI